MRVVLIDGDNNLHRAFHKFTYMKNKEGQSTSMIYGYPMILGSLLKKFKPDDMICVYDYGKHKRRLELLPGYKDRTKKDRTDFERQRNIAQDIGLNLGIGYVRKKGHEADDMIYWLCREYKDVADEIIIVSEDKDFHQLVSDQVKVWSPRGERMFTHLNKHGLTPKESLEFLILDGDSSDKIPGYPGVGEKTALALLERFGSIQKFLKSEEEFKKIDKDKLRTIYKRNKELIGIKTFFRRNLIDVDFKVIRKGIYRKEIAKYTKKYDLKSFNKESFFKPFEELEEKYNN